MKLNKNKKGKQELHPSNFKRSCVKFISYINENDGTTDFDRYMAVRMEVEGERSGNDDTSKKKRICISYKNNRLTHDGRTYQDRL